MTDKQLQSRTAYDSFFLGSFTAALLAGIAASAGYLSWVATGLASIGALGVTIPYIRGTRKL